MKTAAAYIRVSTSDQLEYSPDSQLKCIREYADKNGLLLPEKFIFQEDDGISGRGTKQRTEFQRMIGAAKLRPKPFDCVLLWKFSRFARSRTDSVLYKSLLRRLGIEVISVSEPLGDGKTSILMEALIEAMDEYYSINLAEEVRRGMREKIARGEPVTAPPFGYRLVEKKYLTDPETAPAVRMIFRDFAGGNSFCEIAEKLNAMGLRTKRGNRWESRSVRYILNNPVYAGTLRWNPCGHTGRSVNTPETFFHPGIHEPLIDKELWNATQDRLAQSRSIRLSSGKTNRGACSMLRGLVFCSSCGRALITSSGDSLQCCGYCHGLCRESHSILRSKLEEMVTVTLEAEGSLADILITPVSPDSGGKEEELVVRAQLRRTENRLTRLREAYLSGIEELNGYRTALSGLLQTRDTLQNELLQVQKKKAEQSCGPPQTLPDALRGTIFSSAQKNLLLRSLIQKIRFDRRNNRVEIIYRRFSYPNHEP